MMSRVDNVMFLHHNEEQLGPLRTWRNPLVAGWGGRRTVGILARWPGRAGPRSLCWVDTDPCDWASVSSDTLWTHKLKKVH